MRSSLDQFGGNTWGNMNYLTCVTVEQLGVLFLTECRKVPPQQTQKILTSVVHEDLYETACLFLGLVQRFECKILSLVKAILSVPFKFSKDY